MLKLYNFYKIQISKIFWGGGGAGACAWNTLETGVSFFLITHDYIHSKQK